MLKKKLGIEAIEADWSLRKYFKIPSTLIIPPDCEYVGTWTFYFCDNIEKVVIPESVGWIGEGAFEWCKRLKEVEISNGCKRIGARVFAGCMKIEEIVIPESVVRIEEEAFSACFRTDVVIINKSSEKDFKYLGRRTFRDCFTVKYVKEETRN